MDDTAISAIKIEDTDTQDSLVIPVGKETPPHHFIYIISQRGYRPWSRVILVNQSVNMFWLVADASNPNDKWYECANYIQLII